MRLHILGICGTFMASLAVIAKELGWQVSGTDDHIFPPMSTLLAGHGIPVFPTEAAVLKEQSFDLIVIGNAKGRGDPNVEWVLSENLPYTSGPAWLANTLLKDRWVITAAGTHGKTTTSAMVAWILERAGLNPGFLIGGLPRNFGISGRVGKSPFFVIEGDEYDSAFFDKRSKFIHYHTKTAIVNNIELDHCDIFKDVAAIQKQFHHFIRTVPGNGKIIANASDPRVQDMLAQGAWTPIEYFNGSNATWQAVLQASDGSAFTVFQSDEKIGEVSWELLGHHNVNNALAAIAAVSHAGVSAEAAAKALCSFKSVKRRLEIRGVENNITVYDDFAHHPTEIQTTLNGLRHKVGSARIFAVIEFVSNSMKRGMHNEQLVQAFAEADKVFCRRPEWDIDTLFHEKGRTDVVIRDTPEELLREIVNEFQPNDHIVVMSNKGFGNIYDKLLTQAKSLERTIES